MNPSAAAATVLSVAVSDIRANLVSWSAYLATLFTAGTGVACALALLMEGDSEALELGGTVLGMALLSVFAATSTLSGLIVNERRRVYARWKLAGMSGATATTVILCQVLLMSFVGALPGTALAPFFVPSVVRVVGNEGIDIGSPWVSPWVVLLTVLVCASAALLGVFGKAWSVGRQPAVVAFRGSIIPSVRPGVSPTLFGLLMLFCLVMIALEEDLRADPTALLGLQILLFMALIPLLGWYLRPLLQWSRLLRFLGPVPQVAAGSVRVRSAFTSALVLPWFLLSGMIVGSDRP